MLILKGKKSNGIVRTVVCEDGGETPPPTRLNNPQLFLNYIESGSEIHTKFIRNSQHNRIDSIYFET